MYPYIILGIYYFCGITYFIYNDFKQAKKNNNGKILVFDQNELFDKLIEEQ